MNTHSHDLALSPAGGDAQAIIDCALNGASPDPIADDLLSVLVPAGARHELVDLTPYGAAPRRQKGTYKVATVQSFNDLVRRHDTGDGHTTIWVHPTSGAIVAVLNDHGSSHAADWGDHRVHLTLLPTEEWKRWLAQDGKLLDQEAFAEHLQDGITEIAAPPAAQLIELAQTLQGTTDVAWKSGVSLRDGSVQLGYTEEASATAGRDGSLPIPEIFQLVMAPFVGEAPVQVNARLRWRLKSGRVTLGYKLEQPEHVIRDTLDRIAGELGRDFPGMVFTGEPRA